MNSFERDSERDLHYTSFVSLSIEDVLEIKFRLVKEVDSFNAIVKSSNEDAVYCLVWDFFTLDKS